MPIYEYECQACGHQMEAMQRMADDPLKDCPECGKAELKKLISAVGFRLSGGGWYETDFKTGSKKNVTKGEDSKTRGEDSKTSKPDSSSKS